MRSVVGSKTELFILSSEKSLKSDEKQIIDNLLKFEDGYTDDVVARNQLREVVTEIFPEKSGIAAANSLNPQDMLSFLTLDTIKRYVVVSSTSFIRLRCPPPPHTHTCFLFNF
jgi:hypothetical protein